MENPSHFLHQVAKIAFNFNNRRQWNWIQLIVAISELHLTQFPDTERELWLSVGLTVVYMESEEFLVNCWVCTSPYQLKLCNYILYGCREIDACLKGLWFIFIVHLIPVLAGLDLPLGLKLAKQPSAIMRTSKIKVCHLTSDLPQAIGFQVSGQNLNKQQLAYTIRQSTIRCNYNCSKYLHCVCILFSTEFSSIH